MDVDKAWNRFQERIRTGNKQQEPARRIRFTWMHLAASLVIMAGLAIGARLLLNGTQARGRQVVHATVAATKDTLPDGSVVTLNKDATISYPRHFEKRSRQIKLEGEAFFQVSHDANRPFTITVNDVEITVLGTSFNVNGDDGRTQVVVETGRVRVSRNGRSVVLEANERTEIGIGDTAMTREPVSDRLYNYYRSKVFVCDDTPLWRLAEVLGHAYGVRISFARPELRELRMNTTFNNESLDQVLRVIAATFDISISKEGENIILK